MTRIFVCPNRTYLILTYGAFVPKLDQHATYFTDFGKFVYTYNHFRQRCDTSRFSVKYCKTSLCNVEWRPPHIVLAIDIQTSNTTLNGEGGEREVKFRDGMIVERRM